MIIGVCGFIGSGKDTIADYLVNIHEYRRESFANTLKDAVSAVFGWDRTMLEGRTKQAREWREQVDPWWSKRLDRAITPRWILQYWGTEVCRKGFHDDIWIASLENKLRTSSDSVVISDCRFPNEIKAIKEQGGKATNAQLTALAVNDLKNIWVNLNNRLIKDMFLEDKILTDEDMRDIRSAIKIVEAKLKNIIKKK
jgi:hypothetical protein